MPVPEQLDAVVLGTGFSGVYMLHRLELMECRPAPCEAEGRGVGTYWQRCDEIVANSYEGFVGASRASAVTA